MKTNYSGSKYIYDDKNDDEVDRNGSYAVDNCEWIVEEVTKLPVVITSAGYATLYAPVALTPVTATAHTITIEDKCAMLSDALDVIPAETGVILAGEEGTYDFTIATTEASATSELTGTIAKAYVDGNAYVLAKGTNGVGLYRATLNKNSEGGEGTTHFLNNAFKAYLPASINATAPMYSFSRGEGTTSIDDLESTDNSQQTSCVYDLLGRRVENPTKGVYIMNGKKVVMN